MHIAMWSGPRNLSTAIMYSFGARTDFDVVDEPFYGAYLKMTDLDHPMGDQIKASMECDPTRVAHSFYRSMSKSLYSKQMTHHMIDGVPRDWFSNARHVFLIRHPARVVASYSAKRDRPILDDLGFVQQCDIFEDIVSQGLPAIVIDSFDIRRNPKAALRMLCEALGLSWDPNMLHWPRGGHANDGVWASHWYKAVHNSTGFSGAEGELPVLSGWQSDLVQRALPYYFKLSENAQ